MLETNISYFLGLTLGFFLSLRNFVLVLETEADIPKYEKK